MTPSVAELLWTRTVGPNIFQQRFVEKRIARSSRAGQFVHILPGQRHLFRRAFSVYATDPKAGTFDVLHQVLGAGTRCLSRLRRGSTVDVLGPLGNRFPSPPKGRQPVLVGGGLGMAPLRFWAYELMRPGSGPRGNRAKGGPQSPAMLLGVRSRVQAVAPFGLAQLGLRPSWASDDGTRGYHGTVVSLLSEQIAERRIVPDEAVVYGCGPEPMMAALALACRDNRIPCFVSLERSMPCGFGVCMGCVIEMRDGSGYGKFVRVCRDGPVFSTDDVII
jgi:dihydroorotate dehydrogenase electron transfer subunit